MKTRGSELPRLAAGRRAFSLVEMVAVMWCVGTLLLVGVAALLGAMKVQEAAALAHERMACRNELADQFRADVAESSAAPENADDIQAAATCLILRKPAGNVVVYRWEAGQLERSESKQGTTTRARFPLGAETMTAVFTREGAGGKFIALRLGDSRGHGKLQDEKTFAAALGGDLR